MAVVLNQQKNGSSPFLSPNCKLQLADARWLARLWRGWTYWLPATPIRTESIGSGRWSERTLELQQPKRTKHRCSFTRCQILLGCWSSSDPMQTTKSLSDIDCSIRSRCIRSRCIHRILDMVGDKKDHEPNASVRVKKCN